MTRAPQARRWLHIGIVARSAPDNTGLKTIRNLEMLQNPMVSSADGPYVEGTGFSFRRRYTPS